MIIINGNKGGARWALTEDVEKKYLCVPQIPEDNLRWLADTTNWDLSKDS